MAELSGRNSGARSPVESGRSEGELAEGLAGGSGEEPEVGLAAVGGRISKGNDDVFAVGREGGVANGAEVAEVVIGREMRLLGGKRQAAESETGQGGGVEGLQGRSPEVRQA